MPNITLFIFTIFTIFTILPLCQGSFGTVRLHSHILVNGQVQSTHFKANSVDESNDPFTILDSVSLDEENRHPYIVLTKNSAFETICSDEPVYMGDSAHVVRCTTTEVASMKTNDDIVWFTPYSPRFRVARPLAELAHDATQKPVLYALLHPIKARTLDQAKHIADQIGSQLVDASIKAVSSDKLVVTVESSLLESLSLIASHPEIHWIEQKLLFKPLNRYAHGIMQSGDVFSTPLWDIGLKGEGEVIGCGDTGIDADMCQFRDPNVPVPYNIISSTHRKLTTYRTWGDSSDYLGGHGTHVTGTLAGDLLGNDTIMEEYNGMAPNAKLAFGDICLGTCQTSLSIPDDLNTGFFGVLHDAGARIHSNSWGGATVYYTTSARECDQYAFDNPEALPLFAAGNAGPLGFYKIDSPAMAKNVIGVGASLAPKESWREDGLGTAITVSGPNVTGGSVIIAVRPAIHWGISMVHFDMEYPLFYVGLACNIGDIPSYVPTSNWIAIAYRGSCDFTTKALNVQQLGAKALLVQNNEDVVLSMGGNDALPIYIPAMSMKLSSGAMIRDWLIANASTSPVNVKISQKVGIDVPHYNKECMASFSSRGPTYDIRFKPEIVASGHRIYSTFSDGYPTSNQCPSRTLQMSGTSMATPVMAGTAALLRQYFRLGYYYDGVQGCDAQPRNGFIPSGSLLKAMLISSTVPLTGDVDLDGGSVHFHSLAGDSLPSHYLGWGRPELSRFLPLPRPNPPAGYVCPSLFVRPNSTDASPTLITGQMHKYCVQLSTTPGFQRDFYATVTWADPPASPGSFHALVNDLDLTVLGLPGTKYWVGNGREKLSSTCDTRRYRDRDNNVEKTHVPITDQTPTLVVMVRGTNVPQGPQPYAMVLNGAFTVMSEAQCDAVYEANIGCPNQCSNHGTCVAGGCKCNYDWHGPDCSQSLSVMVSSLALTDTLRCDEWLYYLLPIDVNYPYSRDITITMTSTAGDPDLYLRKDSMPDMVNFLLSDTHSDTLTNPQIPVPRRVSTVTFSVPGKWGASSSYEYYYVGVFAYDSILEPTSYSLKFDAVNMSAVTSPSPVPHPTNSVTDANSGTPASPGSWESYFIAGGVVGSVVFVAVMIWMAMSCSRVPARRNHRAGFTTLTEEMGEEVVVEMGAIPSASDVPPDEEVVVEMEAIPPPTVPPHTDEPTVPPHTDEPTVPPHTDEPTVPPHTDEPTVPPHTDEPTVPPHTDEPTVPPHEVEDEGSESEGEA